MGRARLSILGLCLVTLLLAGCELDLGYITDVEVAQTAVAQGCWSEDNRPTPFPITVTVPGGAPTLTATVITNPGQPTRTLAPSATPRSTTTPLPRCTPRPGQTQATWPTPLPTEPPYPTEPINAIQPQTAGQDVMRLPNAALVMDAAAHPNASWPAVAAIDIPITTSGVARLFVRVYNPDLNRWSLARTLDRDGSHPGDRFRSAQVGISPDGDVHVVWGATSYPRMQLFYASSANYGETWSGPQEIASPFFAVLDLATTADNELYALTLRRDGEIVTPVLLRRSASGMWSSEELPLSDIWYASSGALTVAGQGEGARIIALLSEGEEMGEVTTLARSVRGGMWQTARHRPRGGVGRAAGAQVLAYPYREGGAQHAGVTFSFTLGGSALYALTSLDGGASWGEVRTVVSARGRVTAGSIGYDALAQRLVAVWNCCEDAAWGNAASTHYAAWSDPTGGSWSPAPDAAGGDRPPLVSGARSAALTQVAHAVNARIAWLVWVEDGVLVRARAYSLDQMIPRDQYPTPTPAPPPSHIGGQP